MMTKIVFVVIALVLVIAAMAITINEMNYAKEQIDSGNGHARIGEYHAGMLTIIIILLGVGGGFMVIGAEVKL
jgi:hypothetical protein